MTHGSSGHDSISLRIDSSLFQHLQYNPLVEPELIMSSERAEDASQQPLLAEHRQADHDAAASRGTFTRNLGAIEAFGIVVSIVIGSGVFTSPGSIDTNVPSPGLALVIWLIGGVLAWTGATTFAELGTAIPGEGKIHPGCFRGDCLTRYRWCSTISSAYIR